MTITPELVLFLAKKFGMDPDASVETTKKLMKEKIVSGELKIEDVKTCSERRFPGEDLPGSKNVNPADVFGGGGDPNIRMKVGDTGYLVSKSMGKHIKSGQPVLNEKGQQCMLPSELENAKAGVIYKLAAQRCGVQLSLNTQEKSLLADMYEHDNWVGKLGTEYSKNIRGLDVKALLSDSTSGGLEVNPEWFDDNLITFPLLSGELLPMVDLREVPRGSAVEGASIGNPTMLWGTSPGTPAGLFDTDALVAEINSTIFTVTAAIEVGRDFLADSAADVGRALTENIGQRMAAELDKVIAIGDGTSQPTGIFTASGLGTVTTGGGSLVVDDIEAFVFGIAKQYRAGNNRCAFISNDTAYSRVRGIPVDASNDARRIFGMSHEDYMVFNRPWKIQNDITNKNVAFGNMSKYRLYRRQGFEVTWIGPQDAMLARRNMMMLIVRGRFGGRVVDASAFSRATDLAD